MSDSAGVVKLELWGKDHWSTLAYAETLAVDHRGLVVPDGRRMTANHATHAHLGNPMNGAEYPTRLNNGAVASGHDDWDCLDDAVHAGMLEDIGTGMNRCYKFTKYGLEVVAALRRHKVAGGNFATFVVPISLPKDVPLVESVGS